MCRYSANNAPIIEFHGSNDTTIPIAHALAVQAEYGQTGVVSTLCHMCDL